MLFKVIAIRPLTGCTDKLVKNLRPNRIYKLYNDYDYITTDTSENSKCERVDYRESMPSNFYDIVDVDGRDLNINLSAIVGKNGSGKSCLAELLFVAMFNFAFVNNLVPEFDDTNERITRAKRVFVEVYYHIGSDIYQLQCLGRDVVLSVYKLGTNDTFSNVTIDRKNIGLFKEIFFYTIGINYSLFGLNQENPGSKWLQHIFHKNDGYRTPIVLSPFRESGTININREEYLTHSRLLANILTIKNGVSDGSNQIKFTPSYSELAPGRVVDRLTFSLTHSKTNFKDGGLQAAMMKNTAKISKAVLEHYNIDDNLLKSNEHDVMVAFWYIAKKLYSISQKYDRYKKTEFQFLKRLSLRKKGEIVIRYLFIESYLNNLLNALKTDRSHITFKLTQSLNYLRNRGFYSKYIGKPVEVNKLAAEIHLNIKGESSLIDVIPPSFFDVSIQFKNGTYFENLSSGEKQRILSSSSYLYHLININSVNEESNEYCRYQFVNILFDEIELYYHPELQRTLVKDVLDNLKRLSVPNIIGINCIFITHSPFILSDIPNNNTLYLSEEVIEGENYSLPFNDKVKSNSFGANIHQLLTHSFFMENTLGEFALSKINDVLNFSNEVVRANNEDNKGELDKYRQVYKIKKEEYKFIYQNIGEDYLKSIVGNHIEILEEALDVGDFIDAKIEKYQHEIEKLKSLKDAENKIRK